MAKVKVMEEKKQDTNLSIRINSEERELFKKKCREKNRDYSEVMRSLISMVNTDVIELEEKEK